MAENDDIGSSGKAVALEARETAQDGRRYSPSAGRNKAVICEVLAEKLPSRANVLEVASGTGEHGAHFVAAMPELRWTYSDLDEISLASQASWTAYEDFDGRLSGPVALDASSLDWGAVERQDSWDAIFCANMIHIAPFAAVEGLFAGAGRLLSPSGRLVLYGPFARDGDIAESNARFRDSLRQRDPSWGVRDLDRDLLPLAERARLQLVEVVDMPANNNIVIFEKT
ncbi:DUF938 domain-containing protein [Henriciella sp. AS95]|uniref:DUF938 domain-containing protein n=1 Tax=Henriciella sp. AS95 TaxID=3135782 RepID=UPI0031723E98